MISAYKQFFLAFLVIVLVGLGSGVTSVYLFRSMEEQDNMVEEQQEPSPALPAPIEDIRSRIMEYEKNHFSNSVIEKQEDVADGTLVKLFYPDIYPTASEPPEAGMEERVGNSEIWLVQEGNSVRLANYREYANCMDIDWYYDVVDRSTAIIKKDTCGMDFVEQTITIFNPSGGKMATLYQGPSMGTTYYNSGNLYILFEGFSNTIYHVMANVDMAPCYDNEKNVSAFSGITVTSLRNGITKSKTLPLTKGTFSCTMGRGQLQPMSFYDDIISFATPVGEMVKIDLQALYNSAMSDTDWTKDENAFAVGRVK